MSLDLVPPPASGRAAAPPAWPRRLWRGLARALGVLGLGWAAVALPVPAQEVPQHWMRYAELTSSQLATALSDPGDATVVRLHSWMQERLLREGAAMPAPLVVQLWIAPSGQVVQAVFAPLGDARVDADLRALLVAQNLAEPPPPDMRQPLVLQLALDFVDRS